MGEVGHGAVMVVECPRCGYDQRGVMASWGETCPIGGVCSECGYEFAWADLLREDRRNVPGFVEHASGAWGVYTAAWRTWVWAMWPWLFWKRVRLEARLRPRRMVWWLVIVVLSVHAVGSAFCTARLAVLEAKFGSGVTTWRWMAAPGAPPLRGLAPPGVTPPTAQAPVGTQVVPSGPAAALGTWVSVPVNPAVSCDYGVPDYVSCWTEPLARYWSEPWRGGWTWEVLGVRFSDWGQGGIGFRTVGRGYGMGREVPGWLRAVLTIHGAMVGLMLVLPTTRRLAKVRAGHLARAVIYGAGWIALLSVYRALSEGWMALGAAMLKTAPSIAAWTPGPRLLRLPALKECYPEVLGTLALAYVGAWWLVAMTRGWKLPQAWFVWVMLMIAAGLAGWTVYLMYAPV